MARNRRINDQQLLNVYINMYEQTSNQIDLLYADLTEIRESIDTLCGIRRRNRSRNHRDDDTTTLFANEPRRAANISPPLSQSTDLPTSRTTPLSQSRPNLSEWFQNLNAQSPLARTDGLLPSFGFGFGLGNFYDSVPVAPTQMQIENATRLVNFSSIENPPNTSCPITLDGFDANTRVRQILHCGHVFDTESFSSWFRGHTHCPVCRHDIREHTPLRRERASQEEQPEVSIDVQIDSVEEQEETQEPVESASTETQGGTERTSERPAQRINQEEMNRIQQMVDNLPFTEEELVNTFTNVTGNILNNLLNIPSGVTSDNSRYYIDASNNLVFESFMRNAFR